MTTDSAVLPPSRLRALAPLCLLLASIMVLDILFMPGTVWQSDALQWREETRSILEDGRLWIDPVIAVSRGRYGEYFVFNEVNGHWYSKYGIVNSLMALPPMAMEKLLTGKVSASSPNLLITNAWSILINLLAAAVLHQTTGRYVRRPIVRAAYVLACFFCTYLWYYQRAQGAMMYEVLFFACFLECMLRVIHAPGRPAMRWALPAWFFIGLLVMTRIYYGILIFVPIVVCLEVCVVRHIRPRSILPILLIPPFVIVGTLGLINNAKFGSPYLSGYHQFEPAEHQLTGSLMEGVWGLLFSGHWSIFLYFPLLFPAIAGLRRFWREHRDDAILLWGTFGVCLLVLAKIPTWRGEWTYGPRYMAFILPAVALPALYVADQLLAWPATRARWAVVAAAAMLLGFSIWLQWEVISSEFWLFEDVEHPLDGYLTNELSEYFYDSPEGMIIHDLRSHRDDLEDTQLFRYVRKGKKLTDPQVELYRQMVTTALDKNNLYWWPSH